MHLDPQAALAQAHQYDLHVQAAHDRLARLAACCRPSALAAYAARARATMTQWVRRGQLGAPLRCCDWPV